MHLGRKLWSPGCPRHGVRGRGVQVPGGQPRGGMQLEEDQRGATNCRAWQDPPLPRCEGTTAFHSPSQPARTFWRSLGSLSLSF